MELKISSVNIFVAILFTFIAVQFPTDARHAGRNNNQKFKGTDTSDLECPENQTPVPSPTDDSIKVCGCISGHVFFAEKKKCLPLYRRGLCEENEYLILKKPSNKATCVTNPCRNDTMVPFNNGCYELNGSDGCPKKNGEIGVLSFDMKTLVIRCVYSTNFLDSLISVSCSAGYQKTATGECRKAV